MLFYMGTVSFDGVPALTKRSPPGSVYRSPQLYAKLRPEMDSDNSSADAVSSSSFFIIIIFQISFPWVEMLNNSLVLVIKIDSDSHLAFILQLHIPSTYSYAW